MKQTVTAIKKILFCFDQTALLADHKRPYLLEMEAAAKSASSGKMDRCELEISKALSDAQFSVQGK